MLTKGAGRGGCLSRRGLSPHGQAYCIDVEVDLGREATVMSGQNPVAEASFFARRRMTWRTTVLSTKWRASGADPLWFGTYMMLSETPTSVQRRKCR